MVQEISCPDCGRSMQPPVNGGPEYDPTPEEQCFYCESHDYMLPDGSKFLGRGMVPEDDVLAALGRLAS